MLRGKLLNEREKRIRPVWTTRSGRLERPDDAALANAGAQLGEAGWIGMAAQAFRLSPQP